MSGFPMTWMLFIYSAPAEVSSASVGYLFSVIGRGYTLLLLEDTAEIKGIVIADNRRNFRNIVVGTLQKADSIVDPNGKDVLHGRLGGDLLEFLQEVADAHIPRQGIFFNVNILVVMILEVSSCDPHFLLQVRADSGFLVQPTALDQNEDLLQIHGKKGFIADTAGLQLQNHFLKQITVSRRVSRIKHIGIQRDFILFQNTPHLTAGKMHPVYFGLVLTEIFVVHFLLWLEQDHIAGGNNNILSFDIKVCFSRSNIKKLPVHSTTAPPRGELVFAAQAVGATATNNQRSGLIYESDAGIIKVAGIYVH